MLEVNITGGKLSVESEQQMISFLKSLAGPDLFEVTLKSSKGKETYELSGIEDLRLTVKNEGMTYIL